MTTPEYIKTKAHHSVMLILGARKPMKCPDCKIGNLYYHRSYDQHVEICKQLAKLYLYIGERPNTKNDENIRRYLRTLYNAIEDKRVYAKLIISFSTEYRKEGLFPMGEDFTIAKGYAFYDRRDFGEDRIRYFCISIDIFSKIGFMSSQI